MKDGLASVEIRAGAGSFANAYGVAGSFGSTATAGSIVAAAGSFSGLVTAGSLTEG